MRTTSALAITALAVALTACQKNESPIKTSAPNPGSTSATAQTSAPAATTDRDSAAAPTPSTHSGAPQPDTAVPAIAATTARDSPTRNPAGEMTKAEESNSMPKPGQTDNHFTPSIDGAMKGSQQSPGTQSTTASSASTTPSTATPSTSK
ncbi:MAG TPA: hypothetical protein VNG69_16350 [Casimicrobiaceae bacterium]|nr:hypothetical protein [Casimicrobiaceae bacterium]